MLIMMIISNNICKYIGSHHLWRQMSHLLFHCSHLNQHQSSLDPWYLEFSSCLNHGQTKTAKGSNKIIWSNNNNNRGAIQGQLEEKKQGKPGTRQGQPGTKQGKTGTKQGQPGTKHGQGNNWTNAKKNWRGSNQIFLEVLNKRRK